MPKYFQSYIIEGSREETKNELKKLTYKFGINLDKASPDNYLVTKDKNHLTIEKIRNLKEHIFQKPLSQKYKFVILKEAETLTNEAQNALLKILEEPPPYAVIVLETINKRILLPTILSRCITISTSSFSEDKELEFGKSDLLEILEKFSKIDNAREWLDEQIKKTHKLLIKKAKNNESTIELVNLIENYVQTKKMIDANVNVKFALINLAVTVNLASN